MPDRPVMISDMVAFAEFASSHGDEFVEGEAEGWWTDRMNAGGVGTTNPTTTSTTEPAKSPTNGIPDQFDEDRKVCEAASPGPWFAHATDDNMCMNARYVGLRQGSPSHDNGCGMAPDHPDQEPSDQVVAITLLQSPRLADHDDCDANMEFIWKSRTRWPAALDEIQRLRDHISRLESEPSWILEQLKFANNETEKQRNALHQILSATSEPAVKKFAEEALR